MMELFSNFHFLKPQWFLLFVPCLLLLVLRRGRGSESAIRFSNLRALVSLGLKVRRSVFSLGFPLLLAAIIPAILALARPVLRHTYQAQSASGIDIMIALDLSLSMAIEDFVYNGRPETRIAVAKRVVHDFIKKRSSDRLGLVIYAGQPYVAAPITLDHEWLLKKLDEIRLEILDEQGTAIGSAIAASATRLDDREAKSKIIVLITDGANNSGKLAPLEAAQLAKELGIKIYTIAIGTEDGRVPNTIQRFPRQEFDLPTLKKIAELTGAEHYWAQNFDELETTFNTIDELEKTEVDIPPIIEDKELFPWFIGASSLFAFFALILMILNPPPVP